MNYDRYFNLPVQAAINGERCPMSPPMGELPSGAISALVRSGHIRSEVYRHNYRVVTILKGPHKGKSTAPAEAGLKPYLVNGVHVKRFQSRVPA